MNGAIPQVVREYRNHHLDSTRWEVYQPRAGDVIVTTSYKSGTTWVQQILHCLLRGSPPEGLQMQTASPWVDACFTGSTKSELRVNLAALPDRRFLKSHLPLDGLPYHEQVQYLIVGRDPRDVFMSLYNHYANYTDLIYDVMNGAEGRVGAPIERCPSDPRALFRDWIRRGWFDWESEGYPFWSNMGHTQSYWEYRDLPNFLFLHYADMLDDLERSVRRIVEFAGIEASEELIRSTVENTTFSSVKERANTISPEEDTARMAFRGGAAAFFNKGTNGRWREMLDADDLALYEAAKARVLVPECARWLEQGGVVPGAVHVA